MRRTRCAIVGAGPMGRWHADAARRAGADIAFVVDADRARALNLARQLRLPPAAAVASLAPALEPGASEVIHICTPAETHAALAREALLAGRHVLVEKPLAESERVTTELLDIADGRGLRLVPVYQFLFQRGVKRALRALPSLGQVLHIDFVACSAGAALRETGHDRLALEILPHAFALAARAVPAASEGIEWTACRPAVGELRLLGQSETATVSVTVSMSGRPTRAGATIICSAGTVHLDFFHGYAVLERGRSSRAYKVLRPFRVTLSTLAGAALNLSRRTVTGERAYPGLRELVRRFYASVEQGGPPPVSRRETLAVARARDRVVVALDERTDFPQRQSALLA